MKTMDEILDLATCHADLPSQGIIDALYEYEDEVMTKILQPVLGQTTTILPKPE